MTWYVCWVLPFSDSLIQGGVSQRGGKGAGWLTNASEGNDMMCVQCYCYSVSVTSVSQREGTGKGVTYQYQCTWRVWHNACAGCCHSLIEGGELKRREGQGGTSQCIWTVWHNVCAECYCYSVSQREGTGEGVTYQYQCIWRVWHDVCAGCCHSLIEGGELKRREGRAVTYQCIWRIWHDVCAGCYC